ncbi:MAG: preprotein translocase subunit SecA [Verrucomicrobiota bacterium]
MLNWISKKLIGTKNGRTLKSFQPLVEEINHIEETLMSLSNEQLQQKTPEFRQRLKDGETLDDILPEAYAVVKNCCRRFAKEQRQVELGGNSVTWNMIPFDVQLIGGIALHKGFISEMATGEGKTLVATLPVYLNALAGQGVHVVTVNDYLASRDAEWMGELYRYMGLSVGCLQHAQRPDVRREQYDADITYGTNSEFGFDYLRDNGMATRKQEQVQRGHTYAIIDEVDSILIDEARTPLIISGPATVTTHQFDKFKPTVEALVRKQRSLCEDLVREAKQAVEAGDMEIAGRTFFKIKTAMPRNTELLKAMEDPEMRSAIDKAELALYQDQRKTELFALKEELYFSIEEKSQEADLSDMGRHALNPDDPEAFTIPDLVTINHDIDQDTSLSDEEKDKKKMESQELYDEASQRIHNISQLLKAYCVFEKDVHYVIQENKVQIVDEFTGRIMAGRRWSDGLHQAVEAKEGVTIEGETQTLATITIQNYFRLYDKLSGMTGTAETEANEFKDIYKLEVIMVPTNRPCLRDDFDDLIFKTQKEKYKAAVEDIKERHRTGQPVLVGTASVVASEIFSRMLQKENIQHSVLNAKFHESEAEIVARAGQKGAVTISTNMAGRGTDIKLGEGVAELGGLHVLGTERHESRRIDRQLRGRCARQGDQGSSQFFISFEDDLMRNFGDSRRMTTIMTKLGMEEDEGLCHPWLNRTVETAQKRVEGRNYQMRKHTLQYDDVMNQQRQVIYTYRNDILEAEDPRNDVYEMVEDGIRQETDLRLGEENPDMDGYVRWINSTMPLGLSLGDLENSKDPNLVADRVIEKMKKIYELKVNSELPEAVQSTERFILLNSIDRLWQEHLYAMDSLRTSISLRAHGQKDPLIEYKQEAYGMFEELMANIKRDILGNLFRSMSSLSAFEKFLNELPQNLVTDHYPGMAEQIEASKQTTQLAAAAKEEPEAKLPIRREQEKFGRNERVVIRRGNDTQTVKFKKADMLLNSGWILVGRAEDK